MSGAATRSRPRPAWERCPRAMVAGGAVLVSLSLVVPYSGWAGLRTVGPAVGAVAVVIVTVGLEYRRRPLAVLGGVLGLAGCALTAYRLAHPAAVPTVVALILGQPRSTAAVWLGAAGSGVAAAGALLALQPAWPSRGSPPRLALEGDQRVALAAAWRALWTSRLLVWTAGVVAVLKLGEATVGSGPAIARPFGHLGNVLAAPAGSWDAGNYLAIAQYGYRASHSYAAFFPVYPTLVRLGGWSAGAAFVTGIAVSLISLLVALYLLFRLVTLECGARTAQSTVLLVAFFPMALFFSAIYSESVFLALSVGAVYSARRDWWARAGICGGLAAATRPTGVLILVPVAIIYLFGPRVSAPAPQRSGRLGRRAWPVPRYRLKPDIALLLLVPLGVFAYFAYQGAHGDWLAPFHAQQVYWHRRSVPLLGALEGARDLVRSLRQLAAGSGAHYLPTPSYAAAGQLSHPIRLATADVIDYGFLTFGCIAAVGALRRLPAAYGAYVAVSVAVSASTVPPYEPLMSFPRFLAVVFPCQMWLALWAERHEGRRIATVACSAGLLALFASQFATWVWVA